MIETAVLYGLLWVTISYLIYRYGRYSDWSSNEGGKAFMAMKLAFWVTLTFVLAAVAFPGSWVVIGRFVALGLVEVALLYQVHTVVKLQGGWRRRRTEQERDRPEFTGHRRRRILAGRLVKREAKERKAALEEL